MRELDAMGAHSLKGALEALLLVSSEAVTAADLAQALGVGPLEVATALGELATEYADTNRGFQLREVAGGWRLYTHPAYHDVVEGYVLSWDTRRLSQAALETLAVIAYHQPVSREGVRAVRGVNSDSAISSLKEKRLVREVGHVGDRSRTILYGTTQAFLEKFGLRSLDELPPLEDFAPDEQSRQFIRERLSGRSVSPVLEDAAADIDEEQELLGDASDLELAGYGTDVAEAGGPEQWADDGEPKQDWVAADLAEDDDDAL